MSASVLLQHCDKVRETGNGKWIACCPAHEDRSPSLAIRECSDGRVLIHCFAGCEVEDVLGAVGLAFADIMPERLPDRLPDSPLYKPTRFDSRQVLECISHELMVVSILAEKYAKIACDEDDARLMLASERINTALKSVPQLKTPPELKAIRRAA